LQGGSDELVAVVVVVTEVVAVVSFGVVVGTVVVVVTEVIAVVFPSSVAASSDTMTQ